MATINGKKIEVPELKFREFKQLMKVFGGAFDGDIKQLEDAAAGKTLAADLLEAMPEMVTKALAVALRLDPAEVDEATPTEILNIIPLVIETNHLLENLSKIKKIKGLVSPAATEPDLTESADEIRRKLAGA